MTGWLFCVTYCSRLIITVDVQKCLFCNNEYFVSETICDPPPSIDNADATAVGIKHTYDDMVLYTCRGDMRFAYGKTSKTIICMENRKWNETDFSCEGKVTLPCIEFSH